MTATYDCLYKCPSPTCVLLRHLTGSCDAYVCVLIQRRCRHIVALYIGIAAATHIVALYISIAAHIVALYIGIAYVSAPPHI